MSEKLMKILILYFRLKRYTDRNTINEHLYSFRRYVKDVEFHYFNAAIGIPWYLRCPKYDGIILHYTFLSTRWDPEFFCRWSKFITTLSRIRGYKVAIPQDEYAETETLWRLFREYGVRTVFTCFSQEDYEKAYPRAEVLLEHLITVFPGYVDEVAAEKIALLCTETTGRPVVLGYRARKLPYWLGRQGQLKYELAQVFTKKIEGSGLKVDISTDDGDALLGDEWYRFLCRCRAVLGCEGGASLMDPTGQVRAEVEQYMHDSPNASFEEVESTCFPGRDHNIRLFTLSPRHFECAITRTCQVLLEGQYGGIFLPGRHYIEIKKDYSNMDLVIEQLSDEEHCAHIAENAFRDIAKSDKYTYRAFATQVVNHIAQEVRNGNKKRVRDHALFLILGKYLSLREQLEPLLVGFFYLWLLVKFNKFKIFGKLWKRAKQKIM